MTFKYDLDKCYINVKQGETLISYLSEGSDVTAEAMVTLYSYIETFIFLLTLWNMNVFKLLKHGLCSSVSTFEV